MNDFNKYGLLLDFFNPENYHLLPKLPKVEITQNNITYEMISLTYLNERAITILHHVLSEIVNTEDCKVVNVDVSDIEPETVDIISDILLSISVEAKKCGRNAFNLSQGVFGKISYHADTLSLYILETASKAMYQYAHSVKNKALNYYDLMIAVADASHKEFEEHFKEQK